MLSKEELRAKMAEAVDGILSNHVSTMGLCIHSENIAEAALQAILSSLPEIPKCADISDLKAYIKTLEGYREMWEQLWEMRDK